MQLPFISQMKEIKTTTQKNVTISMDDVLTSYFVSGSGHNTLSMLIYSLVKKGVKPDINALSTIMIVLSVLLGLISQIAGSRSKGRSEE